MMVWSFCLVAVALPTGGLTFALNIKKKNNVYVVEMYNLPLCFAVARSVNKRRIYTSFTFHFKREFQIIKHNEFDFRVI